MPWFEAHDTMARHPKTLKLARLLGVDRRYAVGLLHDLFSWGLYAATKDGTLPGLAPADIAQAMDWPVKKTDTLVGALLEAGYLEKNGEGVYTIHDWYDYAGKLFERREKDREKMKRYREGMKG
jgi:DNA-binding IclR family transcriptional regulator